MDGSSVGALVPSVSKAAELGSSVAAAPPAVSASETTDVARAGRATVPGGARETAAQPEEEEVADASAAERDKDLLCPICMGVIKDAFLTACGHSFCYVCIVTHLNNKSDCPCCGNYLTKNHLFPNFLLNKLLKKQCARKIAKTASPTELLHLALQQGCALSIKELDGLLSVLSEKKQKMEQQEAEMNMQILLEFLQYLRKKRLEELNEVQTDLQYIKEDVNAVEKHRAELYRARERYSVKLQRLLDDPIATKLWSSTTDQHDSILVSNACSSIVGTFSGNLHVKGNDVKAQLSHQGHQRKYAFSGSETTSSLIQSGRIIARKRQVESQLNELQECYLQKRRVGASQLHHQEEKDAKAKIREGYHTGLEDFRSVLTTFTRYSRLRIIAELRHGDLFHAANIVSSIEFDCDDEFFATAGVSKCIKVFDFSTVVNEPSELHCPVVEMATRSKLSCLSWNKYSKNIIVSSDYEGIVTVWDVTNRQSVMEYEEHEKRAWSVDFSRTEPTMLVSGSDDCKVNSNLAKVICQQNCLKKLAYRRFVQPFNAFIYFLSAFFVLGY